MSWFSDKNKKLYSDALNALYNDSKTLSVAALNKTKSVIFSSYDKVKETVEYLDKKYHEDPNVVDPINNDLSFDQSNQDTDEYVIVMESVKPDILIKLKPHISKIWIIVDGIKTSVSGKITSYPYINTIINQWFEYDTQTNKWIPTTSMLTEYRKHSDRLKSLDFVLFKHDGERYIPS